MKSLRGIGWILVVLIALCSGPGFGADEADDLSAYYGFGQIEIIKIDWGINGLEVVDLNCDGLNDVVVVNNRKAKIELLLQKQTPGPEPTEIAVDPNDADVNALAPQERFVRESIVVSQQIFSMVCGDLNSDGLPDIAFYGDPKSLYVILQRPEADGAAAKGSVAWRTRKKIAIEDGFLFPAALACADLSGDGRDDLALASKDGVYVVTQQDDGTTAEPVKYPISGQILRVDIADLDGDGLNDLVLVTNDADKPVQVRFGREGGYLGPQVQYFIERPFVFRIQDIDDAGGDEVLTIDARSGRLVGHRLEEASAAEADWPVLLFPLASGEGSNKRDLVVGDFDGDGRSDIVVSDPGSAELIFYRQQNEIGLAEPVRFPALAEIVSLSAADVDRDGRSELAVLSVKEKVAGLSSFVNGRLSFPRPLDVEDEPVALELVDMDGNGWADCVYISKDANDARFLGVTYDVGRKQGSEMDAGGEAGRRQSRLALKDVKANPEGMRVLDADQDGLADLLLFASYELPTLVRQVGPREFAVVNSVEAQTSLLRDATMRATAVANVDGKAGDELLVAQKNFARSLVFADGAKWSVVDQYNAKSTENTVSTVAVLTLADTEKKQRPAIALLDGQKGRLQILRAGSDETYRFEEEVEVGKWGMASHLKVLAARVGPGATDSVVLFDSEKFAILRPPQKESGAEHLEQLFSYETKIKDGAYGNLIAGDVNSDGRIDIALVEYKNNHIEILAIDSSGQPVPAMRFKIFEEKSYREDKGRTKAGVEPREMVIADVTNDGKADLITLIHDRLIVYPQD